MEFCLNIKNGNIYADVKHIVYFDKYCGGFYPYIKMRGKKKFLTQKECGDLISFMSWCRDKRESNFGSELNTMIELNKGWCNNEQG